jgi:hypothetical protein
MKTQFKTASFRNKDSFQQDNMIPVLCPFSETCPRYGVARRKKSKEKCSGRLFDVSRNNGLALISYYCKSQRKIMIFRQKAQEIEFMGIPQKNIFSLNEPLENLHLEKIICPTCGDRILDVKNLAGDFHLEIRCTIDGDYVTIDNLSPNPFKPPQPSIIH